MREGCDLALCDIDEAALAAVGEECRAARSGAKVSVHRVDMGSRSDIKRFAAEVKCVLCCNQPPHRLATPFQMHANASKSWPLLANVGQC